jgi:sucrose-6-phosphate hydrolase SacC (GH32 family)
MDVKVSGPSSEAARDLKLHIFVDRSVLEVLVNDIISVTKTIPTFQPGGALTLRTDDGTATFNSIRAWPMHSIWKRESTLISR